MILGKNFKFYKIEIFSGVVIATPALQLRRPLMLDGVAIATPALQLQRRPDCTINDNYGMLRIELYFNR